jgi:hypothetical protein
MLTQASCSNSGESDGASFAADGASFAADGASFAADGAARAAVGTASSEHEGNEAPKNPRIAQRTYVALYPWWWHHTTMSTRASVVKMSTCRWNESSAVGPVPTCSASAARLRGHISAIHHPSSSIISSSHVIITASRGHRTGTSDVRRGDERMQSETGRGPADHRHDHTVSPLTHKTLATFLGAISGRRRARTPTTPWLTRLLGVRRSSPRTN